MSVPLQIITAKRGKLIQWNHRMASGCLGTRRFMERWMPDANRRELARIARKYDVTILEDDVYGFLIDDAPPPIATYAPERTYFLASTSKSIAPGLRIGYVVCPPGRAAKVAATLRATIWETSPILAEVVTRWIEDGTANRVVAWKQNEIRARHHMGIRPSSSLALSTRSGCL